MTFLVDTSAWMLMPRDPDVRARLADLTHRFLAATTPPVIFELLTAARDGNDMRARHEQLRSLHLFEVEPRDWNDALEVYAALADRGPLHHRQVARADVLIAVVAARANATVLHYDRDFDRIAEVTGQPTEWIAPAGSL